MEERKVTENDDYRLGKRRCVNLDWLEVFCFEPISSPRNADYFREKGYIVEEREYGTRIYNEMFTLMGTDYFPLLEIRRNPKSSQTAGGLLPINACHIRLVNRTCYVDNAAMLLQQFLQEHGIEFQRISRVDVCLDFERFDSGDWPQKFLIRYLMEKYAKINQAHIAPHGEDTWTARRWDSISWGREKSDVSTKMYNKSKQLNEVKDKPYIKQAWFLCGLVDNPVECTRTLKDGTIYRPDIWRVEFSVRSSVKGWFVVEKDGKAKAKQSVRNTLAMWAGREQLLAMFSSLANHYFRFKIAEPGKRKDLCKDKVLFKFGTMERFYKVERIASPLDKRHDLEVLISRLNNYKQTHTQKDVQEAVSTIIKSIDEDMSRRFISNPHSRQELVAFQQAVALKFKHHELDISEILRMVKDTLSRNELSVF